MKKVLYNRALRVGGETTEGFTDLVSFCNAARKDRISQRTIELMVHPAAAKASREAALLTSEWEDTCRSPCSYSITTMCSENELSDMTMATAGSTASDAARVLEGRAIVYLE